MSERDNNAGDQYAKPEYTVKKIGTYIRISCCQLTDAGLGTCDHPATPKPPLWRARPMEGRRMVARPLASDPLRTLQPRRLRVAMNFGYWEGTIT